MHTRGSAIAKRPAWCSALVEMLSYNHERYQQILTTTIVVDDAMYSPASASMWTRTNVANGHKVLAVKRLSRRILGRSKNAIFTYPPCIWSLLGVIPSEFHRYLLYKTVESLGYFVALFVLSYF